MTVLRTLKSRRQFLSVAGERRKVVTPGLIVQLGPQGQTGASKTGESKTGAGQTDSDTAETGKNAIGKTHDGPLGVGYTASRRVGGAVERNRAKRRMRALAADILPDYDFAGRDVVLIARPQTVGRPFALLRKDLHRALKRLHVSRRPGNATGRPAAEPGQQGAETAHGDETPPV